MVEELNILRFFILESPAEFARLSAKLGWLPRAHCWCPQENAFRGAEIRNLKRVLSKRTVT